MGTAKIPFDDTAIQTALDGKVDDSQVLTDVPEGAVFTDTVYDDTAIQAEISNHVSDTENPHQVTATQVDAYTKNEVDILNRRVPVLVKATEIIAKGDLLSIVGYNQGEDAVEVAKSVAGSIVFAVAEKNMASGDFVDALNTGVLEKIDTSSFSLGDILYRNITTGTVAKTKPTTDYQTIGYVVKNHQINGAIFFELTEPNIHLEISSIDGLQSALDGKVDDAQVLTNVPLGAVFTDTVYDDTAILTALDGKVDDAQVLTNVPLGAVFTDTVYDDTAIQDAVAAKQDTLVSSVNIKTINSQSILGPGNIVISGGGLAETFETISKNLEASNASFNFTGQILTSIVYANGWTKSFTYTIGVLTQMTLTDGITTYTKTFTYTSGVLTSIAYT